MTSVVIAPRVEDLTSDTEAVASGGWFRIRPARAYKAGGQWVHPVWPATVTPLNGTAVTVKLDPVADVPYELELSIPDGNQGTYHPPNEFRYVTASASPLNWEDLIQEAGPGVGASLPGSAEARLLALETLYSTLSGGASTLSGITDMTAVARTLNAKTSTATMLTYLGAAGTAGQSFTGTTALADVTASGNVTITGDLSVGGTVTIVDGALSIADVTGLQAALDAKSGISAGTIRSIVAVSGVYAARPATTDPVFFVGSVAPAPTGSTAGGGGMVPSLDQWFETP